MVGPPKKAPRRDEQYYRSSGPSSASAQSTRSTVSSSTMSVATSSAKSSKSGKSGKSAAMSAIYDGPKDVTSATANAMPDSVRRMDGLGVGVWNGVHGVQLDSQLPLRKGRYNTLGREAEINLNTFEVLGVPTKPVYQYDITMVDGHNKQPDKRMLINKIWKSKAVQSGLGAGNWLFDGNKLAWASIQIPNQTLNLDIDAEEGRTRSSDKNKFKIRIESQREKVVKFDMLTQYLAGKTSFHPAIYEQLAFLDHLMREYPTSQFTQIKKSFFAKGEKRFDLGGGIEAFKGVFASMRMVLGPNLKPGLSVNVDVANGTFFTQMDLLQSASMVVRARNLEDFQVQFQKAKGDWHRSNMYKFLKAFTHVGVYKQHMKGKEFKVNRFLNVDPYDKKFDLYEPGSDKKKKIGESTVAAYFKEKYNHVCRKNLPLVEMTKQGDFIPLELLTLLGNQRYRMKLDDKQTSQMIKFAVTLPKERWEAVQQGINMLNWPQDPNLSAYGLKISSTRTTVKGRILPCPEVTFASGKIDSKTASSGRWRIDGKKFLVPNTNAPLRSWGIAIVDPGRGPCINLQQGQNFAAQFMKIYRSHGGIVQNEPFIMPVKAVRGGDMITDIWNGTGNKFQAKPAMLFFVVPTKDSELYKRIKKSCECRYGVVSQVMQSVHVMKAQDQYISNVCMKVNAKLGGSTCQAVGQLAKVNPNFGKVPTMIIGADVSHAAPGVEGQGSMAAFTMSLDRAFTRYAANCQTNGNRVEIISTENINTILKGMFVAWAAQFGGRMPSEIFYYRDGVSEGQYTFVLEQEVKDMQAMVASIDPKASPKFTVVICAKRHHIRFFPNPKVGDRNGNPQPGTLVETGVTHPFEFDFYLASHSAIKGTARPVHYHVIRNDSNYAPNFIEQLTFEHCFQYMRSTTPVSMFPAVYYAHLASNRATAHTSNAPISSGKKQAEEKRRAQAAGVQTLSTSSATPDDIPDLMPLNNERGILGRMWYI